MAGETVITVIGNLTADPELRFTPSGAAVANFTVASTPRTFDRQTGEWKDGEALFLRCNIWRQAAENTAESLTRGTDRIHHVGHGDRAEQLATGSGGFRCHRDGAQTRQRAGDFPSVIEIPDLPGLLRPADRRHLLFRALGGHDGQPPGQ